MRDARQRAFDKIVRLSAKPRGLVPFWRESSEVLASALSSFDEPCWYTVDPASLLVTRHDNPHLPALPREEDLRRYPLDPEPGSVPESEPWVVVGMPDRPAARGPIARSLASPASINAVPMPRR